jgi:ABC-type nitrate/sulfonate/bicarbonate transport system substrate-binding protein
MTSSSRVSKRTKLIGFILLGIVILLAIVFSLGTRREEGVQTNENPDRTGHPIYSKYRFDHSGRVINFGVQPLYLPTGLISEVMKRDRVLQQALKDLGMEIRYYPFLKGDDVNFFLTRHDLDMGVGGDMPAITAAADMEIVIPLKVQDGFTSIVATRPILTHELRKNRIAYPFGSISHFVVLDVLASEGFKESNADLVSMDAPRLAGALKTGEIDAFAVWEPMAAMAIKKHPEFVTAYQQMTSGYLYFSKAFFDKTPEAVPQIVASVLRAFWWMKKKRENLLLASKWSREAGEDLAGQEMSLSDKEIADLAKKDILAISFPMISRTDLKEDSPLYREFEFLKTLKKIPSSTKWARIRDSFDLQIITEVMANRGNYHLDTFYYGLDNPKSRHGGEK